MGRFYKTSAPDFVEGLIKKDAKAAAAKAQTPDLTQLVDGKDYLPDDWAKVEQITSSYNNKINGLVQRVYKDPSRSNDSLLEGQSLAQQWSAELNTGELAALKQRKEWYDREVKSIQEAYKDDPVWANLAVSKIEVPSYQFDEQNRAAIAMPQSPDYINFSSKDYNSWLTNTRGALKEDMIERGILNREGRTEPGSSVWSIAQINGLTEDKILETYINSIPDEAIRAEVVKARLANTGVDESSFYSRDNSGKIVLNLDTKLGRLIQSEVTGLKHATDDTKFFQATNPYTSAHARSAYGSGSADKKAAGTDLYTKYNAHMIGDPDSYQAQPFRLPEDMQGKTDLKFSNFMQGMKVGQKEIVGVVKEPGKRPQVILVERKFGGKLDKYTRQDLNSNTFQTTEETAVYNYFTEVARERGTYTDDGYYKIDYTGDLGGGKPKSNEGNTGTRGGSSSTRSGGSSSEGGTNPDQKKN
jgi:hypothetical protein